MFVPDWVLWTIGVIAWFGVMGWVGSKGGGDWDFVALLLTMGVFFIGVAFLAGFLLKGCIG